MSRLPASRCFSREHPPFLTRVQNFHRPLSSCSPLLFVFPVGSLASWLTRRWNLKLFHSSTRNRWILRGSLRLFLKRPPSSSVLLSLLLPFLSFLFFFFIFLSARTAVRWKLLSISDKRWHGTRCQNVIRTISSAKAV